VAVLLTYVTVSGAVKQKVMLVFSRARHAHKTDPVFPAAMFGTLAKSGL